MFENSFLAHLQMIRGLRPIRDKINFKKSFIFDSHLYLDEPVDLRK